MADDFLCPMFFKVLRYLYYVGQHTNFLAVDFSISINAKSCLDHIFFGHTSLLNDKLHKKASSASNKRPFGGSRNQGSSRNFKTSRSILSPIEGPLFEVAILRYPTKHSYIYSTISHQLPPIHRFDLPLPVILLPIQKHRLSGSS